MFVLQPHPFPALQLSKANAMNNKMITEYTAFLAISKLYEFLIS